MEKYHIRFGLMKTALDAHTMGIHSSASLFKECGCTVFVAPKQIEAALDNITIESNQKLVVEWVKRNKINILGISYRLDPENAVSIVGRLVKILKDEGLYESYGSLVDKIYFAGLQTACNKIDTIYNKRIITFRGGETPSEMLEKLGIPKGLIPSHISKGCRYDKELLEFGELVIKNGRYKDIKPFTNNKYAEFGTIKDSLIKRLYYNFKEGFHPLIRAHSGPYSAEVTREECLIEYNKWCKTLAEEGYLDILSIGSSQLSQSHFGKDWGTMLNGGGVPINSEAEYRSVWEAALPMLVRTYSATSNIVDMAQMYDKTINTAWHALSLWWFNELDGRGSNSLYDNLIEHITTMKYLAKVNKPVEANVPHHFSFRGSDDVTYIVSAYLAAKIAKKCGIRVFVLQNMLNTPRATWGVQDLAKSRAMISLVKQLEDKTFRVVLQTRAGLDYFKPDLELAKIQLAAVTAMMDDIDPNNIYSPEIIHVVSYSEGLFLATPDIINDSIKITRQAMEDYRAYKIKDNSILDEAAEEIVKRQYYLQNEAKSIIDAMESNIENLYSAEGLYIAFVGGWLPVPELWSESEEFVYAKDWETKLINGGIHVSDKGIVLTSDTRINKCLSNIKETKYVFKEKYKKPQCCI